MFTLFGIKIAVKNFLINPLTDCCGIVNLPYFIEKGVTFKHPFGIVIHKNVKVGKNCAIYQHVTIGYGKYSEELKSNYPVIGDNVKIYPNSCLFGGIKIGNNVTIGAGSIVFKDVPDNAVVAGNPARIIRIKDVK